MIPEIRKSGRIQTELRLRLRACASAHDPQRVLVGAMWRVPSPRKGWVQGLSCEEGANMGS